ncbi:uncharacterized protein L969DRAFT_50150 [Mixia osmundae IAM 14324]|uniref:uncharacterized protein n=1 Tax=Mixia osmundae (strain CBS 9802 / IAM 14324 / JCM 22182 / KY 12970) TaxID=764103 RepID=UPI0004A55992|nr:uncharacterized protein L969DRAFT_50150 [Mixia osmundae IAM 14324]KEI38603.1 hypothetical protein L969DRAFT_50150 [Mixia osmundae IAM 14324]
MHPLDDDDNVICQLVFSTSLARKRVAGQYRAANAKTRVLAGTDRIHGGSSCRSNSRDNTERSNMIADKYENSSARPRQYAPDCREKCQMHAVSA